MTSSKVFMECLGENNIDFYTGVPDSLLKDFNACINAYIPEKNNIIAANEGNAIACAGGYYLATGKTGVVYMQNSGLGNCVNPLTSLADTEVYSIPILLIIGWRGEPGVKDEPQHIKQGRITCSLLDTLEIPYSILPDSMEDIRQVLQTAVQHLQDNQSPYALIVRKGTFEPFVLQSTKETLYPLAREKAINLVVSLLKETDVIISTTGKTSREIFELREAAKQGHSRDFLTIGSMGHASSIALGIALHQPDRNVYCFDGDGALIMHMGSLSSIGKSQPANFKHIVFNNYAYESVGGQPTASDVTDIPAIARANGYNVCYSASTEQEIIQRFNDLQHTKGPGLLEIRVNTYSNPNLKRPTTTPKENKDAFMNFLKPQ